MTLDELIERLLDIRRACPAAGTATCIGFQIERPHYERGEIRFGTYDPRTCQIVEIEFPIPPPPPGSVH